MNNTFTQKMVQADALVKTGGGKIHTLTFTCNDAAPTAGSISVYDSITEAGTAAAGTLIYSETFTTTVFRGYSVVLDCTFNNGLYVGFTTTADVNCTVTYS
jgi:hypothetical protein